MRIFKIKVLETNWQMFLDSFLECGFPNTFCNPQKNYLKNEEFLNVELKLKDHLQFAEIMYIFGFNHATQIDKDLNKKELLNFLSDTDQ